MNESFFLNVVKCLKWNPNNAIS